MRFLCLHGRGTNSDIIESQLAPLRSRLSAQHSFDFVDAQFSCPADPAIEGLFPPPFLCWYNRGTPEEVRTAQEYLLSVIDEDGPYDGVIGFSEGAALAASLLLSPSCKSHFNLAILFNSVVPLVPSEELGQPLSESIKGHEDGYIGLLCPDSTESSADGQRDLLAQARCFSPQGEFRIDIPTIHVIGERDPFAQSSRVVVDLCQPELAQLLVHDGGHAFPQEDSDLDRCAELIEMATILNS